MRKLAAYTVILLPVILPAGSLASETGVTTYKKDASQFCFPKLNADEQIQFYSRIVNIGASFSHGCMGCDQNEKLRGYTDLTGDSLWFRRNYLLHFLSQTHWKKEGFPKPNKIAILENDAKSRPEALLPESSLKADGYRGEWIYDTARDSAHLTDPEFSQWLQQNTPYGTNIQNVGGIESVSSLKSPRRSNQHGVVFQGFTTSTDRSLPAPVVYDLAVDGGRMQDLFGSYLRPELYQALDNSKWTDKRLREQAVQEAALYIKRINPSLVLGVDTFFWDSVSRALSYMRESRPSSFIVRLVLNYMAKNDKYGRNFNEIRRANVSQDFFKVLELVSTENQMGPAIPVLLAKMHDNPLQVFSQNNYEPILAAIFGQYFEGLIGVNFAEHLAFWLRKIAYLKNAHTLVTPAEQGWQPHMLSQPMAHTRTARTEGFFDDELEIYLSGDDVEQIRESYEQYESQLNQMLTQRGIINSAQSHQDAQLSLKRSSGLVAKLANWLLLKAIKDLPLFMESLEKAMQSENISIRAMTSKTTNNTHIVNVDKFYEHFPYFIKPETMHPSVFGAKEMAQMINKAICSSGGGQ